VRKKAVAQRKAAAAVDAKAAAVAEVDRAAAEAKALAQKCALGLVSVALHLELMSHVVARTLSLCPALCMSASLCPQ